MIRLGGCLLMLVMFAVPLAGSAYLSYSFWTGWRLREWAPFWRGLVAGGIFLASFVLGNAFLDRALSKLRR